jgi:sulfur-oxidizing protein SoxA
MTSHMIKVIITGLVFILALVIHQSTCAGPAEDRKAFIDYFESRFPDIPFSEYANGIYAIDQDARNQWLEIEEFPPYEFAMEEGAFIWQEKFPDEKSYSDCFKNSEAGVRQNYPQFDRQTGEVITLELAIRLCQKKHGQQVLEYGSEKILALSAFMAFNSRGKTIDIVVYDNDARALAAYEEGKRFYYSKRGQLNFSCADCHVTSVGQYVRADRLSAGLGHPTHFPVYRSKFGSMLSLHQRFAGCIRDVRAKPFELQSTEYRNLEYFLTYMSNGLEVNGPGSRK